MIAHFDCFSGISGDMTLGALLDLGVDAADFREAVKSLGLSGYILDICEGERGGLRGKRVNVAITEPQPERRLSDVRAVIEGSPLSAGVKERALSVFARLAGAEAAVHGVTEEEVHFHEVGAVDAIIDVTGAAWLLEALGVTRVTASPLPMGAGFIRCAHGLIPNPPPAVVRLTAGVPVYGVDADFEFVTPTGAAIVSTLAESFGPPPAMILRKAGQGLGSRDLAGRPNALRVLLGEQKPELSRDRVAVLSTNIDDMNPEIYGHLMDRLLAAGALDVLFIPALMKKGRPGTLVEVLAPPELSEAITLVLLSETTTLGVRRHDAGRVTLPRRAVTVETPFGPVAAKEITAPDGSCRVVPEYESCRRLALDRGLPLKDVYAAALKSCS